MSEGSNNIAPHRGDNKIVTQLRVTNQRIYQMTNEFEIGWREIMLMIMAGFKLGMNIEKLMLGKLLGEITLMWISL